MYTHTCIHTLTNASTHTPARRQLNKKQREVLASDEGALAARLAKQLVTIVTDLKQPDVVCVSDHLYTSFFFCVRVAL